jgi:O-antigen ligase
MSVNAETAVNQSSHPTIGSTTWLLDAVMAVYIYTLLAFNSLPKGVVVPNALLLVALVAFSFTFLQTRIRIRFNTVTICASLILLGGTLPILVGAATDLKLAIELVVRFSQFLVMIFLLSSFMIDRRRLMIALIAAQLGFLTAFLVGHVILHLNMFGRAVALYGNPNSAAFFSMFAFFMSLIMLHIVRDRFELYSVPWIRRLAYLSIVCAFWLIWASNSRKVLLAVSLPLILLLVSKILRSRHRILLLVCIFSLVSLGSGLLLKTLPEEQLKRLSDPIEALASGQGPDRSSKKRLSLYEAGLELIQERPLLGYGGGAFLTLGRDRNLSFDATSDTHSIYMDLYLESGLLGILSYLFIFALTALSLLRKPWSLWQRLLYSSFLLSMLVIQSGGSLQLDKIQWFALVFIHSFATLPELAKATSTSQHPRLVETLG